jgi:DNA-binding transcriptional MerR regulator
MGYPATIIPEKIFFKIGEVCELVGVQAHVLRYWESEFSTLAPQKNRSGQRTYRRRDVEMALRIKVLLYDELYTIAGAKKRLTIEMRDASKLKAVPSESPRDYIKPVPAIVAPSFDTLEDFDDEMPIELEIEEEIDREPEIVLSSQPTDTQTTETLREIAGKLFELRKMLTDTRNAE